MFSITRVSAGILPFAAALVEATVALMNFPALFWISADGSRCAKAYSEPIYPNEYGVCAMIPATPGLPFAACPTGKSTVLPDPKVFFQLSLTLDK